MSKIDRKKTLAEVLIFTIILNTKNMHTFYIKSGSGSINQNDVL